MKFTRYEPTVDAFRIPEITENSDPFNEPGEFLAWMDKAGATADTSGYSPETLRSGKRPQLEILTPKGYTLAYPGDWIVRDERGEFHAVNAHIFEKHYRPAGRTPDATVSMTPSQQQKLLDRVAGLFKMVDELTGIANSMAKCLNDVAEIQKDLQKRGDIPEITERLGGALKMKVKAHKGK